MSDAHLEPSTASSSGRNWWLWASLALAALIGASLMFSSEPSPPMIGSSPGHQEGELARTVFDSATETLDRLEQFDTEPALRLVLDRLNQWSAMDEPKEPWELDPFVKTLPEEPTGLTDLPMLQTAGKMKFLPDDGNHLLETSWLRNIARTARGTQSDDLIRATRLFDWTVRNIQLEDWSIRKGRDVTYHPAKIEAKDKKHDASYLAREVLLFGRGDYVHRAWIFALLARQENLDVVLLAVPDKDGPHGLRVWLPALVQGGQLYLFDTYLGLPLPGPDGRVATLEQVLADPSLLQKLDTPKEPYPLQSEDLKGLVALIEGSPAYLLRRMQAVEARLAGPKKVVLSTNAAVLAGKLRNIQGVKETRLWPHPYEVLLERNSATPDMMQTIRSAMGPYMIRYPTPRARDRRVSLAEEHPLFTGGQQAEQRAVEQAPLEQQWCSLWTGRILHFKGIYTPEGKADGALEHYREVMVKDDDVDAIIDKFAKVARLQDPKLLERFRAEMREIIPLAKQDAIYWLGLIAYDRGNYPTSEDYLQRASNQKLGRPWRYGAAYNLARNYEEWAAQSKDPQEAQKLLRQAIKLLEEDQSPQASGNHLRAQSLKSKLTAAEGGS